MSLKSKRVGAVLAAAAMVLHALWPLVSQAAPKSVLLVPLCTVGGETHYVEVPGGKTPAEDHSASQLEHCALCLLGADRAALACCFYAFESLPLHFSSPDPQIKALETTPAPVARARAPPVSRVVHSLNDEFWRNHEEDSALRPRGARAGAAVSGLGLLRRGFLLD